MDILHSDPHLLIINKPAKVLVVPGRPAAGAPVEDIKSIMAKSGKPVLIVHRLDKDTSGALVLARTKEAHRGMCRLFERGQVQKQYLALVWGNPPDSGRIDIALHAARKSKMRPARSEEQDGITALTEYTVLCRTEEYALLAVYPHTGRQHQIRVHLKAIGHPIVGDRVYGKGTVLDGQQLGVECGSSERKGAGRVRRSGHEYCDLRLRLEPQKPASGADTIAPSIDRTALHLNRMSFLHPITDNPIHVIAPLPDDFKALLDAVFHRSDMAEILNENVFR